MAESRGSASGGVQGAEPLITSGASQGVNPKTVRWTVFGEGTPCKRRRPLVERMIVATIIRILWDVEDAVPYIMLNYDLIRQRELSCLPYISVLDNYGKIVGLGVGLISEVTAVIVAVYREHYLVRGT